MIRRLNYTGRRNIARNRVTIRLLSGGDATWVFGAEYDLAGMGFPQGANVFIEAYNATSYMRFAFGTVGQREAPQDLGLHEITRRPLPKFRLKVVDNTRAHGLLIGVADKLIPVRADEQPEQRQSLLPVDFCDLGDRAWRLDLSDWPVLELNRRIDSIGEAARSSGAFLGLVYPEVVRRILHEIVIEQELSDPGFDDSEWTSLWLRYACTLPGIEAPPDGVSKSAAAQRAEWIEAAVDAFCRSRQARRRLEVAIDKEISQ